MQTKQQEPLREIHDWFSLSYASYLTLPRSVLQSMPAEWQDQFTKLLDELSLEALNRDIETPRYTVVSRDDKGRFVQDPFRDYQRGRRDVFREYPRKA